MEHRPSLSTRVYATALWLYPTDFRRDFAADMVQDFEDAASDARQAASMWRRRLWWLPLGWDLLTTASVQWWRTGIPLVVMCAGCGAAGAAMVAALAGAMGSRLAVGLATTYGIPAPFLMTGVVFATITGTALVGVGFGRARRAARESDRV